MVVRKELFEAWGHFMVNYFMLCGPLPLFILTKTKALCPQGPWFPSPSHPSKSFANDYKRNLAAGAMVLQPCQRAEMKHISGYQWPGSSCANANRERGLRAESDKELPTIPSSLQIRKLRWPRNIQKMPSLVIKEIKIWIIYHIIP